MSGKKVGVGEEGRVLGWGHHEHEGPEPSTTPVGHMSLQYAYPTALCTRGHRAMISG
jgi:hypothetical protein